MEGFTDSHTAAQKNGTSTAPYPPIPIRSPHPPTPHCQIAVPPPNSRLLLLWAFSAYCCFLFSCRWSALFPREFLRWTVLLRYEPNVSRARSIAQLDGWLHRPTASFVCRRVLTRQFSATGLNDQRRRRWLNLWTSVAVLVVLLYVSSMLFPFLTSRNLGKIQMCFSFFFLTN